MDHTKLPGMITRALTQYTKTTFNVDACNHDQDTLIEEFPQHAEDIVDFYTKIVSISEEKWDTEQLVATNEEERFDLARARSRIKRMIASAQSMAVNLLKKLDIEQYVEYCVANNIEFDFLP